MSELRCRRLFADTPKLFHLETRDGFNVGTIDLRGAPSAQIDHPHATFAIDQKKWRKVTDRPDAVAYLTGLWATQVRKWHDDL